MKPINFRIVAGGGKPADIENNRTTMLIALASVAILVGTNIVFQPSPASAENTEVAMPIADMLDIFDQSCIEVFVRQESSSLNDAFQKVGLTQANGLHRLDPDRPVFGYLNEDYFRGGMYCAIEFASRPELDGEVKSLFHSYNISLPGEIEDKKLSTPPIGGSPILPHGKDSQQINTANAPDELEKFDPADRLVRQYKGTRYYIYLSQAEMLGPNDYVFTLKFGF